MKKITIFAKSNINISEGKIEVFEPTSILVQDILNAKPENKKSKAKENWRWTSEEDRILTANYGKIKVSALEELIDARTPAAIKARAKTLGLQKHRVSMAKWTADEDAFLENNKERLTLRELAQKLNRTPQAVSCRKTTLKYKK